MSKKHKTVISLCVFSLMVCICSGSQGAVIRVPADQSTIQAAVNAANPDDEIRVASSHIESASVTIDKDLSIISYNSTYTAKETGAQVVNAVAGENGIVVATNNILFEGLGKVTAAEVGIACVSNPITLTMIDCTIADCGDRGVDTYANDADVTITGCTFDNNTDSDLDMFESVVVTMTANISDCTFGGGGSGKGLAIASAGDTTVTISNCRFDGNEGGSGDGALKFGAYAGTHSWTVSDCEFGVSTVNNRNLQVYSQYNADANQVNVTANFDRCIFMNSAGAQCLAVSGERGSHTSNSVDYTFTNCLIVSLTNTGCFGSLNEGNATIDLQHCTLVAKDADPLVSCNLSEGSINLQNCMLYGGSVALNDNPTYAGTMTSDYNFINSSATSVGDVTLGGNEIVGEDPLFVDDTNDDYHIQATSQAFQAGTNLGVTVDLDGVSRGSFPSMGCYESESAVDNWTEY